MLRIVLYMNTFMRRRWTLVFMSNKCVCACTGSIEYILVCASEYTYKFLSLESVPSVCIKCLYCQVYTVWTYYEIKEMEGNWFDLRKFVVIFENVPNYEEFINEFTAQGKQIAESYEEIVDGKRTNNKLVFDKATTTATDEQVFGSIGESISEDIEINIRDYNSVSGVVNTKTFLDHIGAKSKPLLKKHIQSHGSKSVTSPKKNVQRVL
eukprot:Platyproteum_vivax@DN7443_c0_g2_i2.p1